MNTNKPSIGVVVLEIALDFEKQMSIFQLSHTKIVVSLRRQGHMEADK